MIETIFILAKADREELAAVRTQAGLQVAEHQGEIWLRGLPVASNLPAIFLKLPILRSFRRDAEDRLFRPGALTPIGLLPDLEWTRTGEYLPVEAPVSALPGRVQDQVRVSLKRIDAVHPGTALLTDLTTLQAYAETAPAARLNALRFALSKSGQALLLGTPLPSLPGQELYGESSMLLPAGHAFSSHIMGKLLQKKLNPLGDNLLVFHPDGSWGRIPLRALVPVTRSGIRLSPAAQSPQ